MHFWCVRRLQLTLPNSFCTQIGLAWSEPWGTQTEWCWRKATSVNSSLILWTWSHSPPLRARVHLHRVSEILSQCRFLATQTFTPSRAIPRSRPKCRFPCPVRQPCQTFPVSKTIMSSGVTPFGLGCSKLKLKREKSPSTSKPAAPKASECLIRSKRPR